MVKPPTTELVAETIDPKITAGVAKILRKSSSDEDSEEEKEEPRGKPLPLNSKGDEAEEEEEEEEDPEENLSPDDLAALCDEEQVVVTPDEVLDAINSFIETIPEIEGYNKGEIKLYVFSQSHFGLSQMVGAGTAILDAILYLAVGVKYPDIFSVRPAMSKTATDVSGFIARARGVFISWSILIMCRGSHPDVTNTTRPLPAICLKDALVGMNINNEKELALECSSAPLKKFPSSVMMQANVKSLPERFYQRIVLAPAGCRAIRYAMLASTFPKRSDTPLAKEIAEYLVSVANHREVQLNLHPMRDLPEIVKIPKFTLKMTRAIMESLTPEGRNSFVDSIMGGRMESFKKDPSFSKVKMGRTSNFAILNDVEASFDGLTLDLIKNHCEYQLSSGK